MEQTKESLEALNKTLTRVPDLVVSDEVDNIELSEDELKRVIRAAKSSKLAEIKYMEYCQKIKNDAVPTFFAETYLELSIKKFENETRLKYEVDENNKEVLKWLSWYFTSDKRFEEAGFSLAKGLLLHGNVGCGKTTIMRMFSYNQLQSFSVVSCRTVANTFSTDGYKGITKYFGEYFPSIGTNPFRHQTFGICFDDLGTESQKKNFGNESNVMAETLLNRYDAINLLKNKTHITTNLGAEQIKEQYGSRVASRMREMFNIIQFKKEAGDRRK